MPGPIISENDPPFFCSMGHFSPTILKKSEAMYIKRLRCILHETDTGFPQKFKNTIPRFFHDQQCNFHDYLMHRLQPLLLAATLPH